MMPLNQMLGVMFARGNYEKKMWQIIAQTSYCSSNDANNVTTPWITNFWPTQARVPEPKGRNATLSFGSFKTNLLSPGLTSSSATPDNNYYQIFVIVGLC